MRLLGTGSPKPNIERHGPSQLIMVDNEPILIDCGEGTTNQLLKANIQPDDVKYLLFTHLHSDHVFGYSHFLLGGWSLGRNELTIFGPRGLKKLHEQIITMFEEDINYRCNVLGISSKGLLDVNVVELPDEGRTIKLDNVNVDIESTPVVHNVHTFAYRFDKGAHSIVISGDTAPVESLIELSKDANVLVQDAAISPSAFEDPAADPNIKKIRELLTKEHCSPMQAGEIAEEAGVKKLVLTHLLPNTDRNEIYHSAKSTYSGQVIVGEDLDKITVD